jgi:hypothetical protein
MERLHHSINCLHSLTGNMFHFTKTFNWHPLYCQSENTIIANSKIITFQRKIKHDNIENNTKQYMVYLSFIMQCLNYILSLISGISGYCNVHHLSYLTQSFIIFRHMIAQLLSLFRC